MPLRLSGFTVSITPRRTRCSSSDSSKLRRCMAAIFGSAVRRVPRFISLRKNSVTCFSMGATACSKDNLPMSECRDSAIDKRLTAIESAEYSTELARGRGRVAATGGAFGRPLGNHRRCANAMSGNTCWGVKRDGLADGRHSELDCQTDLQSRVAETNLACAIKATSGNSLP